MQLTTQSEQERVVKMQRPSAAVVIGNQTYNSPLTERVIGALNGLREHMGTDATGDDLQDSFSECRTTLLSADLYTRGFENRTGPVFEGARKLYLNALRRSLLDIKADFESGARYALVTQTEIATLCGRVMSDVLYGKKAKVVFDSRLAYAEPNNSDHISRAERRYHGVKWD